MIDSGRSTPSAEPSPVWFEQAARYFWDERGSFGTDRPRGRSTGRRDPRHRHTCSTGTGTARGADPVVEAPGPARADASDTTAGTR